MTDVLSDLIFQFPSPVVETVAAVAVVASATVVAVVASVVAVVAASAVAVAVTVVAVVASPPEVLLLLTKDPFLLTPALRPRSENV